MKRIFLFISVFISLATFAQPRSAGLPSGYYNAAKYGCVGDGIVAISLGTTTAGSPNIKIVGEHFLTNSPVGKKFRVQGGGTANVDQTLTCNGVLNDSVAIMSTNVVSAKTLTTVDYGTDNTTPIQTLLSTVTTANGGMIFFPRGIYMLFGALQTSVNSVNPNCQIYIPLTNVTSKSVCQLEISGEYANQMLLPINNTAFGALIQQSTVFKSEIDGSGTLPAMFGTPYYVPSGLAGANANFTSVKMKNIIFQNKSQVNNVEAASTMSGLNFLNLNQFSIENSIVGTESKLYNTATQASSTTYGIIFPGFLNNAISQADNVTATGYHWGYLISDHFDAGQLTSVFDYYAMKYENGQPGVTTNRGHDAVIQHLQTELTTKGINVTGESGLHIVLWSGERDVSGNWWATANYDVDFTGSGVSGNVYVDQIDMTNAGAADNVITTNNSVRFKYNVVNGNTWPGVDKLIFPATASGVLGLYNAAFGNTAFADIIIYPQNAASNVAGRLFLSPKGTGGGGGDVADILISNKDFPADGTNVEFFKLQTTGTQYNMFAVAAGTGTVRPIAIYTGANTDQLKLNIDGSITHNGNTTLALAKNLTITEGSSGRAGQTTLVAGTKAITITGITTSSRAFVQVVAQGGTSTGVYAYKAVCTANTLTITAIDWTGTIVTTDTPVMNYFVIN